MSRKKVSFTLTPECMELLRKMAEQKGVSMAATIELLVREAAKKEKIK